MIECMAHRYPFSVINPTSYYGRRVAVYYNLHYCVFSIKEGGRNGCLLTHAGMCEISDATFEVESAGRARAIRQGRKNVHAYVVGTLRALSWDILDNHVVHQLINQGYQIITYNLHREHHQFYYQDSVKYSPIIEAKSVILNNKVALARL
ncbi:hypothetical protein NIES4071_107790 (plasmid) [Calothrix sp. NIES-4071]|nr:hypothetical protein NIES4071_107790 [Calothrix sp. NIES-4071]BAZ64819.1 hypothetical protein NIES4105_105520 [Calothrix sp. NIES-4105]